MSIELSPDILNSVSLYPNIDDNKFNLKIANKQEFNKKKRWGCIWRYWTIF